MSKVNVNKLKAMHLGNEVASFKYGPNDQYRTGNNKKINIGKS